MLRFFRQLRLKLLGENRISNYLLYAIGEIILVVVGILIALYLNDLHAASQERDKELEYLRRFQSDLELNLKELDRVVSGSDSTLMRLDSLLALGFEPKPEMPISTFNRLNVEVVDYLTFQTSEATVEDLIGSGSLGIIEHDSIREAIATWKSGLIVIRALEWDHKKAFNDLLGYLKGHSGAYKIVRGQGMFDLRTMSAALADPEYFNTLAYHAVPLQMLHEEYVSKQRELQALYQNVQIEITSKE